MTTTDLSLEDLAAVAEPRVSATLPGPEARAVIARDASVTSPSLPRAYEFVDGSAYLPHVERVRRDLSPRVTVLPWLAEPPSGPERLSSLARGKSSHQKDECPSLAS